MSTGTAGRWLTAAGQSWRLLTEDRAEAAEGLALDEALMARYSRGALPRPPTLRLYTYRTHCALIGRYQNLDAEVDLAVCRDTGTRVSRRPTGGGAIIMGAGQLGVALVAAAPSDLRPREIISELAGGLITGLSELGISAVFKGKNDLEVNGRKVAGLGLYLDQSGAMLFHASVLADLDIGFMLRALRIPAAKLGDKAASAVAERVTTVTALTGQPWDGPALRQVIASGFATALGADLEPGEPSDHECALAAQFAAGKYSRDSWLADRSAALDGTGSASLKTPAGLARIYLTTHGDLVKSAVVVGDFNELPAPVVAMESALRWHRLDGLSVARAIARSGAASALGVAPEQLVAAVVQAGRQAQDRVAAAPVRSEGSCYFPEPTRSLA
ncbi:MAG TPA: biotin/lipoate A/B protein ligase family protein [Streptosporangiaceae bacterium]|nr:biotin/lipoate A/B protein ligase family protein [Streptosporangiaceae bacterium]